MSITYETRCQECGEYMVLRLRADWEPQPVFVTCGGCIARNGEPQGSLERELSVRPATVNAFKSANGKQEAQ